LCFVKSEAFDPSALIVLGQGGDGVGGKECRLRPQPFFRIDVGSTPGRWPGPNGHAWLPASTVASMVGRGPFCRCTVCVDDRVAEPLGHPFLPRPRSCSVPEQRIAISLSLPTSRRSSTQEKLQILGQVLLDERVAIESSVSNVLAVFLAEGVGHTIGSKPAIGGWRNRSMRMPRVPVRRLCWGRT